MGFDADSFVLAIAAGIAAVLLVGGIVTALAEQWIEFSLLLGIPAGLAAGSFTAAAVYLGLTGDRPARRRSIAAAAGGFGIGFLVTLVVLAGLADLGMAVSLVGSVAVGLVAAAVASLPNPAWVKG